MKKSSGWSGIRLRVHSRSITASITKYATWMPWGPRLLAIDSARMRCPALVGAKPAKRGMPRRADVFPVIMIAPRPASIIAGASARARYRSPITLTSKFARNCSGSTSRKSPKAPPTALCTRTVGAPRSPRTRATVALTASEFETSQT